jgi:hypothetical protein
MRPMAADISGGGALTRKQREKSRWTRRCGRKKKVTCELCDAECRDRERHSAVGPM